VNLDFLIGSSLSSEPFFHVSIGPKIAEQVIVAAGAGGFYGQAQEFFGVDHGW
jgi:hypothetical protein